MIIPPPPPLALGPDSEFCRDAHPPLLFPLLAFELELLKLPEFELACRPLPPPSMLGLLLDPEVKTLMVGRAGW